MKELENSKTRVDFDHKGESLSLETEFLFHALGRSPATEGLNLDQIGVELQKSGHIKTNSFQQSSLSHIYAAGDCAGPHEIVHIAIRQGETAARHAMGRLPKQFHMIICLVLCLLILKWHLLAYYPKNLITEGSNIIR